jgi:SAM-dependent methyltransferase
MLALEAEAESYAGLTAFYAIVHLGPDELPVAFRELFRVLRPGAPLLLSFHLGDERVHLAELLAQPVDLDFTFFARPVVERALEDAGFVIAAALERAPYTAVEHPTRRAYLLARRPS